MHDGIISPMRQSLTTELQTDNRPHGHTKVLNHVNETDFINITARMGKGGKNGNKTVSNSRRHHGM